ncbi:bactofilin family protein [Variovorax sp. HJSM1_2]|uniref:bactofilin family protein n=1 Tax=Variovorax sp. HJSM1_2 TaxID=3366263 RepID=UPI003BCB64FC
MALQSPFFNKRETESAGIRPLGGSGNGTSVLGSSLPHSAPSLSPAPAHNNLAPASTASTHHNSNNAKEGGSKLTVGPNIKLKGVEITDCDTLVVEGLVEATMDSRLMQIAEMGAFKGSAEIDIAEIHGEFDGELTVREKLVIYATGKVTGKIRYGKVVIEEGGQLSGEITFGTSVPAARSSKPVLAATA